MHVAFSLMFTVTILWTLFGCPPEGEEIVGGEREGETEGKEWNYMKAILYIVETTLVVNGVHYINH